MAPGGDIDSIKAAIVAGADAIYFGINRFNARNRAENIDINDLPKIVTLAHNHNCKVYLTLNIVILDSELNSFIKTIKKVQESAIDAVIIADIGMFYVLKKYFNSLVVHASTQMTTHNRGQIDFLNKLNVTRVNLSRELNSHEIKNISDYCHSVNIETEIFVHGSQCLCFSGICYMSSLLKGTSGNRGRCSQPCRDKYNLTKSEHNFPLNLKDSSLFQSTKDLLKTDVDSFKIEGRIKKFHYVYSVVKEWREQLDTIYSGNKPKNDIGNLRNVFNRDYSNSFFNDTIDENLFIDNPMDNSAAHLSKLRNIDLAEAKKEIYNKRTDIINDVTEKIRKLDLEKLNIVNNKSRSTSIDVPTFKKPHRNSITPSLSVLVSSEKEITKLKSSNSTKVFFEIPEIFNAEEIIKILKKYRELIPWFPSILIGRNFIEAVKILKQTNPEFIVSNNTGIAMIASRENINWVAGPNLNITNSYSLACLKEEFNCSGAFISNELSWKQIDRLNPPEDFPLYYSIYHPIELMTTRACLIKNIEGCKKSKLDMKCLGECSKQTTITNQNGEIFHVIKRPGYYNKIYYYKSFLNTEIITHIPDLFSNYLIDHRDIYSTKKKSDSKEKIIETFIAFIENKESNYIDSNLNINETTNSQYIKGI